MKRACPAKHLALHPPRVFLQIPSRDMGGATALCGAPSNEFVQVCVCFVFNLRTVTHRLTSRPLHLFLPHAHLCIPTRTSTAVCGVNQTLICITLPCSGGRRASLPSSPHANKNNQRLPRQMLSVRPSPLLLPEGLPPHLKLSTKISEKRLFGVHWRPAPSSRRPAPPPSHSPPVHTSPPRLLLPPHSPLPLIPLPLPHCIPPPSSLDYSKRSTDTSRRERFRLRQSSPCCSYRVLAPGPFVSFPATTFDSSSSLTS